MGIWITLLMYVRCVTCILNISTGNNQNTDLSFKLMSKCCPYIRHIHVPDCQKITEADVRMISPLNHILVLNMAYCTRHYITTDFCNHCKGIVVKLIIFLISPVNTFFSFKNKFLECKYRYLNILKNILYI